MNEYKKRLAQQGSQKLNSETAAPQGINGIPNSVLNDVFAGKRRATNEMMGHRVDPAPSVMARMSQAFGMDFSGVQVYRSDAMAGTGMGGMAQGNKVVIGSDVDLNTQKGQALLGHEFSHIRAQSMGIGTGNGLLQDAALEHQADNEGLLAARGMSISGESMGMSTGLGMAGFEGLTPLGGGMSATASAPMQAGLWEKWFGKKADKAESVPTNEVEDFVKQQNGNGEYNYLEHIPKDKEFHYDNSKPLVDQVSWLFGKKDRPRQKKTDQAFKSNKDRVKSLIPELDRQMNYSISFGGNEYTDDSKKEHAEISGLSPNRISPIINNGLGSEFDDDYIKRMFENMAYGMKEKDAYSSTKYNKRRMEGAMMYKEIIYYQLKQSEKKYGTLLHDMHPDDINQRMGMNEKAKFMSFNQDAKQFNQTGNGKKLNEALKFKDSEKEEDYWRLLNAFDSAQLFVSGADVDLYDRNRGAKPIGIGPGQGFMLSQDPFRKDSKLQSTIKNGPKMDANQLKEYQNDVKEKVKKGKFHDYEKI